MTVARDNFLLRGQKPRSRGRERLTIHINVNILLLLDIVGFIIQKCHNIYLQLCNITGDNSQ